MPTFLKVLGGCLAAGLLLLILACGATVAAAGFFFHDTTERNASTTQTFAVSDTPTVRIHGDFANVRVMPGDVGQVTVHATKSARDRSSDQARRDLDNMTVSATQAGNVVTVEVSEPSGDFHFWYERHLDLDVTVPAKANVDGTLSAGNIRLDGLTGTVSLNGDAGNVELNDTTLAGASTVSEHAGNIQLDGVTVAQGLTLRSDAGNIDFSGTLTSGASLDAHSQVGNVTLDLPLATDAHLTAKTQAGNISVASEWPVSVSRDGSNATASGDLSAHPSGTVSATTDAGNITVDVR
jgi:hypothetical protein